jgi:hypothetical protein
VTSRHLSTGAGERGSEESADAADSEHSVAHRENGQVATILTP